MASAFSLSETEMDSSMTSLLALMDEVDDIRMSLNPQDEDRVKLEKILYDLLNIVHSLRERREALKRIDLP